MSDNAELSDDAELGLANALRTVEGRAFIAMVLSSMYFLQVVTDPAYMVLQESAVLLWDHCCQVNEDMALEMMREHFVQGGEGR